MIEMSTSKSWGSMVGETGRSAGDSPLEPLFMGGGRPAGVGFDGVETALGDLDQDKVGGDHSDQDEEEADRERGEPEQVGQGCEGQYGADDGAADRGRDHGLAWPAREEGDPAGPDEEHDEGLGGEGLDEPTAAELVVAGVQDLQHHEEGEEVEDGADRPKHTHEPSDEADVPGRWSDEDFGVDTVGGDGELAYVVEEVVEQDLGWEHGQEGKEQRGAGRAEHVPEVG